MPCMIIIGQIFTIGVLLGEHLNTSYIVIKKDNNLIKCWGKNNKPAHSLYDLLYVSCNLEFLGVKLLIFEIAGSISDFLKRHFSYKNTAFTNQSLK
jgi:hypothetical protein